MLLTALKIAFFHGVELKIASPTPQEEWTIRERLILASSVVRSGDQNW